MLKLGRLDGRSVPYHIMSHSSVAGFMAPWLDIQNI